MTPREKALRWARSARASCDGGADPEARLDLVRRQLDSMIELLAFRGRPRRNEAETNVDRWSVEETLLRAAAAEWAEGRPPTLERVAQRLHMSRTALVKRLKLVQIRWGVIKEESRRRAGSGIKVH